MNRLALLLCFVLAVPVLARHRETGFLDRTVTADGTAYRYQVYVPADWNSHQKWPVILFLHGAGERGEAGLEQTQVGLGGAIRLHADRYPQLL